MTYDGKMLFDSNFQKLPKLYSELKHISTQVPKLLFLLNNMDQASRNSHVSLFFLAKISTSLQGYFHLQEAIQTSQPHPFTY